MPEPRPDPHLIQARPYSRLAPVYDEMMSHVDYRIWADYIEHLFNHFHKQVKSVLDISCGTGSFLVEMAKRGYQATGMDGAPAMLEIAREKLRNLGLQVPVTDGDMRNFEVPHPSDVIVSLYDSINYLLNDSDLDQAFLSAYKALHPGGLFIFDVCTEHNSLQYFSDDYSEDTIDGIWFSRYSWYRRRDRVQINDFHIKEHGGHDYQEFHRQRIYSKADLKDCLLRTGFQLEGIFAGYTLKRPGVSTDRIHFIARKSLKNKA